MRAARALAALGPFLLCAAIGLVITCLIVMMFVDQQKWEKDCEAKGGTVSSRTRYHWAYDSKGKSYRDSDTDYYCYAADGRLLKFR